MPAINISNDFSPSHELIACAQLLSMLSLKSDFQSVCIVHASLRLTPFLYSIFLIFHFIIMIMYKTITTFSNAPHFLEMKLFELLHSLR